MASSSASGPDLIVLTVPPLPSAVALGAMQGKAIVLAGVDAASCAEAVNRARPDVPLIVVADREASRAFNLTATADAVLHRQATFEDVQRAAEQAMANRAQCGPPAAGTGVHAPHSAAVPHQLETVGRLAAGLGHEFNNLLLVIEANADLLGQHLPADARLRAATDAIAGASRRAATLTRQLLAFGRQQTLVPAPVALNAVVTMALPALRDALEPPVQVVATLGTDLPHVHVDAAQFRDVLLNLAAIAIQAMPSGGTFTLATDAWLVQDEARRGKPWLQPGAYVRLRATDTGRGIEEHALPHLFEPFFATGAGAHPSGLVLSSVYGLVKQSGGYIWVESRANQGTCVTILLPSLGAAAPGTTAMRSAVRDAPQPRVLLVEDVDSVRAVLTSLLELHGFRVTTAATAEAAFDIWCTHPFDVLLTDVALPGESGPELARRIRRASPAVPVLFMSGHPADRIDPRDLEDARGFLQKPFSTATLVQRLHELLARSR